MRDFEFEIWLLIWRKLNWGDNLISQCKQLIKTLRFPSWILRFEFLNGCLRKETCFVNYIQGKKKKKKKKVTDPTETAWDPTRTVIQVSGEIGFGSIMSGWFSSIDRTRPGKCSALNNVIFCPEIFCRFCYIGWVIFCRFFHFEIGY